MHIQLNFIIEFFSSGLLLCSSQRIGQLILMLECQPYTQSHTISLVLTAQVQNGKITQLYFPWLHMMQWLPHIGWMDISNFCECAEVSL